MNSFATRLPAFRAVALRQPVLRTPIVRSTILQQAKLFRARPFSTTLVARRTKEDDQSAHTITQRIRQLKRMPPELIPLFVVILFALGAACFALGRKLVTDKTLRLSKSSPKKQESGDHEH